MEVKKIKGLGGWLVLPILGFILSLLVCSYYFLDSFQIVEINWRIFNLLIFGSGMFVYATALLLMFHESRHAPAWAIMALWHWVIVEGITSSIMEVPGDFSLILGPIFWTAYFIKSKRVKNTFVN